MSAAPKVGRGVVFPRPSAYFLPVFPNFGTDAGSQLCLALQPEQPDYIRSRDRPSISAHVEKGHRLSWVERGGDLGLDAFRDEFHPVGLILAAGTSVVRAPGPLKGLLVTFGFVLGIPCCQLGLWPLRGGSSGAGCPGSPAFCPRCSMVVSPSSVLSVLSGRLPLLSFSGGASGGTRG